MQLTSGPLKPPTGNETLFIPTQWAVCLDSIKSTRIPFEKNIFAAPWGACLCLCVCVSQLDWQEITLSSGLHLLPLTFITQRIPLAFCLWLVKSTLKNTRISAGRGFKSTGRSLPSSRLPVNVYMPRRRERIWLLRGVVCWKAYETQLALWNAFETDSITVTLFAKQCFQGLKALTWIMPIQTFFFFGHLCPCFARNSIFIIVARLKKNQVYIFMFLEAWSIIKNWKKQSWWLNKVCFL